MKRIFILVALAACFLSALAQTEPQPNRPLALELGVGDQLSWLGADPSVTTVFSTVPSFRLLHKPGQQQWFSYGVELSGGKGTISQISEVDLIFSSYQSRTYISYSTIKLMALARVTYLRNRWIQGYCSLGLGSQIGAALVTTTIVADGRVSSQQESSGMSPITGRIAAGFRVTPMPGLGVYGEAGLAGLGGQGFAIGVSFMPQL